MSSTSSASIQFNAVSLIWADGTPVLREITVTFGAGRTGVVGSNGSGKSTLLRLVTGDLHPTSGVVTVTGEVAYLPQTLTLATSATLAELLGIRQTLDALRAIEAGDVSEHLFDRVGNDWDIETRAEEVLRMAGLAHIGLDRSVGQMSGGEAMLGAIAGLRLRGTPITLLDEPTNDLDREARHRLYDLVAAWRGALVVVSHDVALLGLMDATAELYEGRLSLFGGGYHAYREALTQEQEAARRALRTAEQVLRTEQRQRVEAETKLARRRRYAQTQYANRRRPKIVMNQRKTEAQVSAGRLRVEFDTKIGNARAAVGEQASRVRPDTRIRIDLPDPGVAAGKRIAEFHDGERTFLVQGPERVALTGPNGVGKTRLLEILVQARADGGEGTWPSPYAISFTPRIGYLPQRRDGLDEGKSVLENVRAFAPARSPGEVRAQLARFRFRGDTVDREVATLSGGERFRVAIARLLLANPPSQLLLLDEPTNDLDLNSVDALVDALGAYRGALIVVSHDEAFLNRLAITRWLTLDPRWRLDEG